MRKPPKSSMKKSNNGSESKKKKSVEFALPKEGASPKKLRYGPDGRQQTEIEATVHDYVGQLQLKWSQM